MAFALHTTNKLRVGRIESQIDGCPDLLLYDHGCPGLLSGLPVFCGCPSFSTGSGHARTDWGMPVALQRAAPSARIVSLGQLEAEPEGAPPYDTWLMAAPALRDDPCTGFSMPDAQRTN